MSLVKQKFSEFNKKNGSLVNFLILKSILRFLREVTRMGKNLRASEQILRTHFAEFFRSKIDQQW